MPSRTVIAIDIGRLRLRALLGRRTGGILRVEKTVVEDVPEDLAKDDPEALGEWVGTTLREAGFPRRKKAVIALAREHVGLKRINLPTTDENELPEMTRLAMGRELPFDAQSAVIDFIPIAKNETSTTVLALAAKREMIDHAIRVAKAAKIGIERIAIRGLGSALLLKHLGEETRESILAVDIIGESIEFCVVEPSVGAIRFSRAADAIPWQDVELVVDAVITETRRTWMSYRIAEDSSEVRHVAIMGDRRVTRELVEPLGEMLNLEPEVLGGHPLVDPAGHEMDRLWPLAGLLLEATRGGETIDFANPRKAPDLAAESRKRGLFAAAAIVIALLAAWTFGNRELSGLRADLAAAEERLGELRPQYLRHGREGYRLEHIEQWKSVSVDWLEHLMYLSSIAPPPEQVVLDNWTGSLEFRGVTFDRRRLEWGAPKQVTINVSGAARNRATADSFRESLVRADIYATSSTGPDTESRGRLPYGFTYRLRTETAVPELIDHGEEEIAAHSEERSAVDAKQTVLGGGGDE